MDLWRPGFPAPNSPFWNLWRHFFPIKNQSRAGSFSFQTLLSIIVPLDYTYKPTAPADRKNDDYQVKYWPELYMNNRIKKKVERF